MYRTKFIKDNDIAPKKEAGPCGDVVLYFDIERAGGTLVELQSPLIDYRIYPNQDSSSNQESMLFQLVEFVKRDEYYSKLLDELDGGKRYFNWYTRRLMVRMASGASKRDKALRYLVSMEKLLSHNKIYVFLVCLVINLEGMFPRLFKWLYRLGKRI